MDLNTFKATYGSQTGSIEYILSFTILTVSFSYLVIFSRSQLNFFTNLRSDSSVQIFVHFTEEKSVGVKTMRKCVLFI